MFSWQMLNPWFWTQEDAGLGSLDKVFSDNIGKEDDQIPCAAHVKDGGPDKPRVKGVAAYAKRLPTSR